NRAFSRRNCGHIRHPDLDPFLLCRRALARSDASSRSLPFAKFHRSKPTYSVSLYGVGWGALLLPVKFDPSSGIFGHAGRRGTSTVHLVDVRPLALVGWTGCALWRKTAACHRSHARG